VRGLVSLVYFGACGFAPRGTATSIDATSIDATSIDAASSIDAPPAATSCDGHDDTTVTMHVGGDPTKPWIAFCHAGSAYLEVTDQNFGQYVAGGQSPGSNVRTTYTRLQIDPASLTIDICNMTFATSSGSLVQGEDGPTVTAMPLGIAMSCDNNYSSSSAANVDLTGTPFVVTSSWAQGGNKPAGSTTQSAGGRAVALTGGGYCGWNAPVGAPTNPFNTFPSSSLIALAYMP